MLIFPQILVPNLKFGHCELCSGLATNGGNSRTGSHRPYHSSLHASRSEQFIAINEENISFGEKHHKYNDVRRSLKTITGELGAQVLNKAYKLSNNIVEWANNLNKTQTPIVEDGRVEKSPRLSRRCRSCDPRHLKSEKVKTTNASRFQKKDFNKLSVHKFGSAVEAIKPSLRDSLNTSFYSVLSTQPHRRYSKLREDIVTQEESGDTAENPKSNLNETVTSIGYLYTNVEKKRMYKKEKSISESDSLSKVENARTKVEAGESKERSSKPKCYPMSRNFSFAFFQPLTNAHFFTTLSQCQLDTVSNECPRTLFAPQYLTIEQNFLGRINGSRESSIAVGNALVNKARGIPQKVFQIALLSCYQDLDKTKTINETILNKLICSCKSFLQPSLSTVDINGGELVASKSSISKDILPPNGENNLDRIDGFKDTSQNDEVKTTKEHSENDGVVTVEGKVFKTSDETLNKLLLLVKQTKIAQENCLENPILDQILSPSILRKQVEAKIDLLSSSVDLASDLPDMKRNPLSQMNHVASSSKNDLKFCGEFFSEDFPGGVEFENLKGKPPVSEKSIFRVLKAFKDIVRDDSNSVINSQTYSSYTDPVVIDESMIATEAFMARKNIYNSEIEETYETDKNVPKEKLDNVEVDKNLINRFSATTNIIKIGEDIGRNYPTFFQSIPQKNSELMLQCNSMRLHSFIANYNPNIRRASNLANNSNINAQSKGLSKSHSNVLFKPTQSNNLMQLERSISRGKTLNNKKKITSQALINIFNENLNLKSKANDFPENITLYNLYDDRFDKLREVVVSRVSSTYKSLLAGSSSLKVFPAQNQKPEAIILPDRKNMKTKASLNLEKLVFKPRSIGAMISTLDSNSAQLNRNKDMNVNRVVTSDNNASYFKAVEGENEITRINKLNKLGKKLASSTKKELRYSWKSGNETLSSFTANNTRGSISNTSTPENNIELENEELRESSSHLLKSNNLRIFMPEKKKSIESLTEVNEVNFQGRRQFGILNSNVDSKFYRNAPKPKNVSFIRLRTKTSMENDLISEMSNSGSNRGFPPFNNNNDSAAEFSTQQSGSQRSLIAEPGIRGREKSLLKIEVGGERKIAFDDKEQIDSFNLMKPVNKVVKQSDGVTKLNRYARKLRHSVKYGSVFSDLDKSSVQMKPSGNLVGVMNFREIGKKTKSNNKSSLIAKPKEVPNPFRIPPEINDTANVVLRPDQVENIRERLMSDRSKMSELYKEPSQHDLNLSDRVVLSKTRGLEIDDEGSKKFANIFKKGGSLGGGSGSNKPPSNKNDKKDSTERKVKSIESRSSNTKKKSSMKVLGDYTRDAYKSEKTIDENKISSIELMKSVRSDRPSKSLSAEFLVRPYPTNSAQKDNRSVPRFSTKKLKDNLEVFKQKNEINSVKGEIMSNEVQEKQTENLPSSYKSEKPQSIKLVIEQKPRKTVSSTEKRKYYFGIQAKENSTNVLSKNEYKIKENKEQRETIFKVDEKPKLAAAEPRRRPNTIESFIRNESKDNSDYRSLKQKNTADFKNDENKKIFNERAIGPTRLESRSKSLNERAIDKEPNIDAEFQQPRTERQQDNLLSGVWQRGNSKNTLSNHDFKSSFISNSRKNERTSGKSLFFINDDGSKDKNSRPGTSAILRLKTAKAVRSHSSEYQKVSSPDKSLNSKNEHNNVLSNYEKDNENKPKQEGEESDKIHSTSIRSDSLLTQTNSLYRNILTKDRKDGEIKGLEARGFEYNQKKYSSKKTDKETQTIIEERPKSRKVQNDKVAGTDHQFSKSILKPPFEDVRIEEDKVAFSHSFSKRPSSAILKDTVTLNDYEKITKKSKSSHSAKYLDKNKPSSDSNEQDRTIFDSTKLEGFQTMRVFADERRKETENKNVIQIKNLRNQEELFRSPLSLSKLIQTKSL
ncbi:hypothetical protein LSTR_LSTR005268 [Laodelphax striatellus]|uniref:Uncharacterized protein n=1 Tax=Laodelphax striatellus TaxID=195883 RepID=A0A482X7Z5_LAOST|nr:hypothetical protein LSTR_LSTR005268 [Laodelphax striatellus]